MWLSSSSLDEVVTEKAVQLSESAIRHACARSHLLFSASAEPQEFVGGDHMSAIERSAKVAVLKLEVRALRGAKRVAEAEAKHREMQALVRDGAVDMLAGMAVRELDEAEGEPQGGAAAVVRFQSSGKSHVDHSHDVKALALWFAQATARGSSSSSSSAQGTAPAWQRSPQPLGFQQSINRSTTAFTSTSEESPLDISLWEVYDARDGAALGCALELCDPHHAAGRGECALHLSIAAAAADVRRSLTGAAEIFFCVRVHLLCSHSTFLFFRTYSFNAIYSSTPTVDGDIENCKPLRESKRHAALNCVRRWLIALIEIGEISSIKPLLTAANLGMNVVLDEATQSSMLHCVARSSSPISHRACDLLLKLGANTAAIDAAGNSPYEIVSKHTHTQRRSFSSSFRI